MTKFTYVLYTVGIALLGYSVGAIFIPTYAHSLALFIASVAILIIAWILDVRASEGLNLLSFRQLWYRVWPYGVAVHYGDFLNVGGDENDPRFIMAIVHVRNRFRAVSTISGELENPVTGAKRPIKVNWLGQLYNPEEIHRIPPGSEFRVMIPFADQPGRGLDQQLSPELEAGALAWSPFVVRVTINGRTFAKSFSARAIRGEIEKYNRSTFSSSLKRRDQRVATKSSG